MPQKLYIGNISKGLEQFFLPFNIDNDAFPTLYNAFHWRQRIKRKRGTIPLARLQRQIQIVSFNLVGGAGNLLTQSGFVLEATASLAPTTISIVVGGQTYTDPAGNGVLTGSGGGTGTVNYATGAITITGGGAGAVTGTFGYFPGLPVMGLRDFFDPGSMYPALLAFDTTYSYQISISSAMFFSTSYYKVTGNPIIWDGANYQQFWTTNYQGALWATNGVPGFHFLNGTYISGSGTASITFNFKSGGVNFTTLVDGDVLWFNEWNAAGTILNKITGIVTTVVGAGDYIVTFSSVQIVSGTGMVEILTNSVPGQDGIRWYDGDPTNGTGLNPSGVTGWVNFSPPLTNATVSIDDLPSRTYYLVGATAIYPYKDRLIFFEPWVQTSSTGSTPIQLNDVAIWSWNGTPYYTTSDKLIPPTPSVVPINQTANPLAYFVDQTGLGGWLSAGLDQSIVTVTANEDVLIVGFTAKQTRFVYTGNDLFPFLFYVINSELGSAATFSGITLDRGALSFGLKGLVITSQIAAQRIDLNIPNQVFQLKGPSSVFAAERISSARDFYREWVYFTFVPNSSQWDFPTQTLQYNYRENSWGIHYENFTAHGTYRRQQSFTWANVTWPWNVWNEPWNSGILTALFPAVIAGNPQGFVVIKGEGTGEAPTGFVSAVSNNGGFVQIQSVNHCVQAGDYLFFTGFIGGVVINNQIGLVKLIVDANNYVVDIPFVANGTYLGGGVYTRLIQPLIQTKQFPLFWNEGRQAILRNQKYLLDYTDNAQVTLNIYLSQDPDDAWNAGPIVPANNSLNNSLIYSTLLYTCPESTNIGLTPANINLQMPTALGQYQIWHRMNTSLIGDTFQMGITLDDAQMRNLTYATAEITLHGIQVDCDRGPLLA